MKNGFFKILLAIGLLTSSSVTLAEGNFTYRHSLQGVNGSPTFGMTSVQKEEYLSNSEMCKDEYQGEVSKVEHTTQDYITAAYYNTYTERYYLKIDGRQLKYGHMERTLSNSGYSPTYRDRLVSIIEQAGIIHNNHPVKVGIYRQDAQKSHSGWAIHAFEVVHFSQTDNYQWCKDNGYKTVN